jgi:hypothetical protein
LIRGSPLLSRWLTVIEGRAHATSKLRRLVRWQTNPLVAVAAYDRPFIQAALAGWAGQDILLIVDGTRPRGDRVLQSIATNPQRYDLMHQMNSTGLLPRGA